MGKEGSLAKLSLGVALVVQCLFPVFWPRLAEGLHLSLAVNGMAVAVHEFVCSVLVFLVLRFWAKKYKPADVAWIRYLQWAFLFVAFGDLSYGVMQYLVRLTPKTRGVIPLVHEAPYVLFALLLAAGSVKRALQGLGSREKKGAIAIVSALAVLYWFASYRMILVQFFAATPVRPLAIYTTANLYAIGQSIYFGGLLIASLRTRSKAESAIWFLLLTLTGSDFALRYQDIGASPVILSIFECGWEFALAGVVAILIWERLAERQGRKAHLFEQPMPLFSFRVLTALMTLFALLAYFVTLWLAPKMFASNTPGTLGGHILNFLLIWGVANLLSLSLSRGLSLIEVTLRLSGGRSSPESRPMLAELDSLFRFLNATNERLRTERNKVTKLSSTVAHNLGKPLHAIGTVIHELDERNRSTPDSRLEETTQLLRMALERVRSVSDGMLQERKKMLQTEKIHEAVDTSVALAQLRFPDHHIEVDLPPITWQTEVRDLGVVLSNLIENAAEASLPGQVIQVKVSDSNEALAIEVRDEGSGIAPGLLTQLRHGQEVTTKAQGNGLGIPYVHDWAEINRVNFVLDSAAGGGTVARLVFPRATAQNSDLAK